MHLHKIMLGFEARWAATNAKIAACRADTNAQIAASRAGETFNTPSNDEELEVQSGISIKNTPEDFNNGGASTKLRKI